MPHTHSTTPHDVSPIVDVPATPIAFGRAAPGIGVRDIRVAYDFYAGVLGFTKAFENGDPVRFMVLKKDAAEIHLFVSEDHVPPTRMSPISSSAMPPRFTRCVRPKVSGSSRV